MSVLNPVFCVGVLSATLPLAVYTWQTIPAPTKYALLVVQATAAASQVFLLSKWVMYGGSR